MTTRPLAVAILAAGKGTRMKSDLPKVLHRLGSLSLIERAVQSAFAANPERVMVIVGHGQEQVRAVLERYPVTFVEQPELLGTGHALQQTIPYLRDFCGDLLVLYGDVPLLRDGTLRMLIETHRQQPVSATLLSACLTDPSGYGRVFWDENHHVTKIIEHKDCTPEQRQNPRINSGIYCFCWPDLALVLPQLAPNNQQGEYYLTDAIAMLPKVYGLEVPDPSEVLGINDRLQLAEANRVWQQRILAGWMRAGVTILDPASVTIEETVELGAEVVIEPQTHLRGQTQIGSRSRLGPGSLIENSRIGRECSVLFAVVKESQIGDFTSVGPYAHIRQQSQIAEHCRIGNFVETKNSGIGSHTNAAHLTYIGDATVGSEVNFGAGTIIANYDGYRKHHTTIGDRSKTGANSVLVAPLNVGQDVKIGAGSTITHDLPDDCLAIARARQVIKPGWRPGSTSAKPRNPQPGDVKLYVLRLRPEQDLKSELMAYCRDQKMQSGFIITTVGSLHQAAIRFANQETISLLGGKFEIVSLVGTICPDGAHLHMAIADQTGSVLGGHLELGSLIYTTAEIVLGESTQHRFGRELDPATTYQELTIASLSVDSDAASSRGGRPDIGLGMGGADPVGGQQRLVEGGHDAKHGGS